MQLGPSSTVAQPVTCCTSGNSLETSADETLCHRWRDRHDISAARLSSMRSARSSTVAPPR